MFGAMREFNWFMKIGAIFKMPIKWKLYQLMYIKCI